MKLCKPESFGMFDQHDRGVRHVYPDLDHRRRDQDLYQPALEFFHHGVLLVRLKPPVEETDTELLQFCRLQALRGLDRRLEIDFLRFIDQRIDDIRLTAVTQLVPQDLVGAAALRLREQPGPHRFAARRHRINGRDVQIPVHRHRQRARDRRGRQHEHIRSIPLVDERLTLEHAEFVLLINHRQPEFRECHPFLDQCVGADRNVGRSARQLLQLGLPQAGPFAPADTHDRQSQRLERTAEIRVMLLGQNFGRSHQSRLVARSACHDEGVERDDGFPGPDVALNEPVHGSLRSHVALYFSDDAFLSRRQLKRQESRQSPEERRRRIESYPLHFLLDGLLPTGQRQLQQEQLLKRQPSVSRSRSPFKLPGIAPGRRKMNIADRLLNRRQAMARPQLHRKHFFQLPRVGIHQPFHQHAHLPGGPSFGFVIDRNDPSHVQTGISLVTYHLVLRNFHARIRPAFLAHDHAPGQQDPRPNREQGFEEGLIEEHDVQTTGGIFDRDVDDRQPATAGTLDFHPGHDAANRRPTSRYNLPDRRHNGAVLVAPGQAPQCLFHRLDAEPFEHRRPFRPHPFRKSDRQPPQRSGRRKYPGLAPPSRRIGRDATKRPEDGPRLLDPSLLFGGSQSIMKIDEQVA